MRHPATFPALLPALGAGAAAAALFAAPAAEAGCSPSCSSCCLPQSHSVLVPGVSIAIPGVSVTPPSIVSGVGGSYNGSASGDISVSASASASGVAYAPAYAAAVGNAQAANLLAASGGGGGYAIDQGGSSVIISNLVVEGGSTPVPTQQVCNAWAAVAKTVAVQASCIDDKAVPHPASQLSPDRDVAGGYVGELFRCIAGTHMQYVVADWSGAPRFDHGQTVVCEKNESLWRDAAGALQCRPQKPARDCNERSLLRRFGAGIKVVQASARQCVGYGAAPVVQAAAPVLGPDFGGDGGVGR